MHVHAECTLPGEAVVDVVAVQRRASPWVVSEPGIGRRQYRHVGTHACPGSLDDKRNVEGGATVVANTRRVHSAPPVRAGLQRPGGLPVGAFLVGIGGVVLRLARDRADVQYRLLMDAMPEDGQRKMQAWRMDE